MECEFDVKMDVSVLYDYSLYHTYRNVTGLLGTLVGFLLIVNFLSNNNYLYLIFGIIVVFYLPVALFFSCKKQVDGNVAYKEALHYKVNDEGMEVSQGEIVQMQGWDKVIKAVATQKSIILYTSKNVATIFPREDVGENMDVLMKLIAEHIEPRRVKIRF